MSEDADIVDRLIALLRGASAGYRRAGADGPGLSDVFGAVAAAHDRTAGSLSAVVRAARGEQAVGEDAAHPAWTDLAGAVAQGPGPILQAVERAEGELSQAFQAALDDREVSGPLRDAVRSASAGVDTARRRVLERLAELAG